MTGEKGTDPHARIRELGAVIEGFWDEIARLRKEHDDRLIRRGEARSIDRELAAACNVPPSTFGGWLSARSTVPDWSIVSELVDVLGGDQAKWRTRWSRARAANDERNGLQRKSRSPSPEQGGGPERGRVPDANASTRIRPRWVRVVAVLVAAGTLAVALLLLRPAFIYGSKTADAGGATSTTTEAPAKTMRVVNTWSKKFGTYRGVCASRNPRVSEKGQCYKEEDLIEVICLVRDGMTRTDPTSGLSSTTWYQLANGDWLVSLYVGPVDPSERVAEAGVPVCRAER